MHVVTVAKENTSGRNENFKTISQIWLNINKIKRKVAKKKMHIPRPLAG
jgi:hypothetical protein